jgi:hypothetical protein
MATAKAWHRADGFPPDVADMFRKSDVFSDIEPLLVLPEHQVPLPGGSRPSQSDVWVLARTGKDLVSISVEGKVSEAFGPTVAEWRKDESDGKSTRLSFLCEQIGLHTPCDGQLRYQLLHRTASAVIEAQRFAAKHAILLVHSFSGADSGFDDYAYFIEQLGGTASHGELVSIGQVDGIELHAGWVRSEV